MEDIAPIEKRTTKELEEEEAKVAEKEEEVELVEEVEVKAAAGKHTAEKTMPPATSAAKNWRRWALPVSLVAVAALGLFLMRRRQHT